MKYAVNWNHTTLANLAEIWTAADDPETVTTAAARIDKLLESASSEHGESREGLTRVLICLPPGIEYDVDEKHHAVQVNAVWKIRSRKQ